jgi:type III restriction enzyme
LGLVGKFTDVGEVPKKYLYDSIAYDSPLEKDDILNDVEGVEVFGKIPKSTVRIPTILGETYSPDFMYIVRRKDKNELNLIVECKDVENADKDLRGGEKLKIESAKVFFENLENEGVKVRFKKQLKQENLQAIVEGL